MVFFLLHKKKKKITPSAFRVLTKVSKIRKISNEGVIFSSLFNGRQEHNALHRATQRVV